MSLDQLSNELILEIANYLHDTHYENGSLGPLVCCSRHLNNILSPLLYRTFTQRQTKLAALPNLLGLVMEKPRVGAYIKKLVVRELPKECLDISGYSPRTTERYRTAIESFELPIDKGRWIADLDEGNWDAVVSLLLFFLPSLDEICIESRGNSKLVYLEQTLRHMAFNQSIGGSGSSLKCLKRVSISCRWLKIGILIDVILPFCALASITTIRATRLSSELGWMFCQIPSDQYQVQNLRIRDGFIRGNMMKKLLSCYPSLQKFYYQHSGRVGSNSLLPQEIGEALAHLYNSLEELILLGNDRAENNSAELYFEEPCQPLGSLAKFQKLRCIGTNAKILFGEHSMKPRLTDIIPTSLECLIIRSCEDNIYSQLREFINCEKQIFPVLKVVAIDIPRARAGSFAGIGPDGLHKREEELKEIIRNLKSHPKYPDWEEHVNLCVKELEDIQSKKPSEAEWEEWRMSRRVEKELIAEYKGTGIELHFNLISEGEWNFTPSFMEY